MILKFKEVEESQVSVVPNAGAVRLDSCTVQTVEGKSLKQLRQVIGQLAQGDTIAYATGGQWSSHEMLRYCLQTTGPARVALTTWAVTEDPLRMIHQLINSGQITAFDCVFDYRTEKRKPEALQFAKSIEARVKLSHCHAKILVIQNDTWSITVVSSANFTNNPRLEAGTIFTSKAAADFYLSIIQKEFDK